MSAVGDGDQWQPKAPYPVDFEGAVKPPEVTTYGCDHEANPPVCTCVHDWRIEWSNVPQRATRVARTAVL
ncbi:hypothetical protein SEA_SORORFAGO_18 [Mycobacterium phage SororFago]|nr:hypothetical protein SEA_SORORFAGO_18 [Mycobacterium phage SororFago]